MDQFKIEDVSNEILNIETTFMIEKKLFKVTMSQEIDLECLKFTPIQTTMIILAC
jgi:hypothetical protein